MGSLNNEPRETLTATLILKLVDYWVFFLLLSSIGVITSPLRVLFHSVVVVPESHYYSWMVILGSCRTGFSAAVRNCTLKKITRE